MNCVNHPDRERISFCQNCGRPLCAECSRTVGSGVFCEPCLAARLAGVDAAAGIPPFGAQTVAGIPIPANSGTPNPVLAAVLGFIPGVGAMYNGQYAKGAVHLIVFAILVSIAADANGILETFAGLFIPGWEFYMAFEAYHTAVARRNGTPLPNPFGLNDIGERFGFGKSWMPSGGNPFVPPPSRAGTVFTQDANGNVIYSAADGTTFSQSAGGAQTYSSPGGPTPPSWTSTPNYSQPFASAPPVQPYAPIAPDAPLPPQNRFPVGAVILIGLGLLFFFGSSGILRGFTIQRIFPFFLIGLGVWLFIRKMTAEGQPLDSHGSPLYQQRVFAALRGSLWIILIGVLFLLDTFNILSWSHSWPLFIIVAGVMTLLQRQAYAIPPAAYPYAPPTVPPSAAATPVPSTEIVPTQEGR